MHAPDRQQGEVFLDARGHGRAMRLTWHHEADLVVLSLWREGMCAGTFRLSKEDVNDFIDALVDGLRDAPGVQVSAPGGRRVAPATPSVDSGRPHGEVQHAAYVETGESEYPELSEPDEQPTFLDWAFGSEGRATAS